jgi:hypothetical protein
MLLDPTTSERCRNLANNIQKLEQAVHRRAIGIETVFKPFVEQFGRNCLSRLLTTYTWQPDHVAMLAKSASALCQHEESAVFAHLLDGSIHDNLRLVELMKTVFFRENSSNLTELHSVLGKYDFDAKQLLSLQRVLPVRHIAESAIRGHIRGQQEDMGFGNDLFDSKVRFAGVRSHDFHEFYRPERTTTVLGILQSGFDEIGTCSGRCRHYSPEGSVECFDELREDSVRDRAVRLRIIGDTKLPPHLAAWIAPLDGIMAIDDRFVMKMYRPGNIRTFLERTGSAQNDWLLDHELGLLHEILSDRYLTHDPAPESVIQMLQRYGSNIERQAEEIKAENLRRLRNFG